MAVVIEVVVDAAFFFLGSFLDPFNEFLRKDLFALRSLRLVMDTERDLLLLSNTANGLLSVAIFFGLLSL